MTLASQQPTLEQLQQRFPHDGTLIWIGLRPAKNADLIAVNSVQAESDSGLTGDHYSGRDGKRQVTLFQYEHLSVLEALLARSVEPATLRRNLVIKGINLAALKNQYFGIGDTAVLQMTGICHPCSRMEQALGTGGYNAMRSHCGITARVIRSGAIQCGDAVRLRAPA